MKEKEQQVKTVIKRRRSVPLIVLICVLSLIGFVYLIQKNTLERQLRYKQQELLAVNEDYLEAEQKYVELQDLVLQSNTEDFIKTEARTKHGFISEGEIRFVITNIDAIFGGEPVPEEIRKRR